MTAAGMTVRRDAIGNLIGRWDGADATAATLLLGSHLDSVPDAGRYDGPLGILVAISAIEAVTNRHRHACRSGSRSSPSRTRKDHGFTRPSWGVEHWSAPSPPVTSTGRTWRESTLREAIRAFGGDPDNLLSCKRPNRARAYVEVHIEQGPVLEELNCPVAVVAGIAGQSRIAVTFTGQANHAGTVPMHARRDALAGASEFVLTVERLGRETPGLVATVGTMVVSPGASNVIPGRAVVSLDIRHADNRTRADAVEAARQSASLLAAGRNLELVWETVLEVPAVCATAG